MHIIKNTGKVEDERRAVETQTKIDYYYSYNIPYSTITLLLYAFHQHIVFPIIYTLIF